MRGEGGREGRGGLSDNVAEEAFCLKSAPAFDIVSNKFVQFSVANYC